DPEELLFQLLFKSVGYSPFSQIFEERANNISLVISDLCFGSLSREHGHSYFHASLVHVVC
ncbi:MAG: hypothetical protein OSB08_08420, partial [SAR324 cluster bacterium]|nr:hypothetical protein [SAR324 cluster bacterium]